MDFPTMRESVISECVRSTRLLFFVKGSALFGSVFASLLLTVPVMLIDYHASKSIQRVAFEMLLFSVEAGAETGPSYQDAKEEHAKLLLGFLERMEQRTAMGLFGIFSPPYDPERRLRPVFAALKKRTEDDTSADDAICEATAAAKQYYSTLRDYLRGNGRLAVEELSEKEIDEINVAVEELHRAVEQLAMDPSSKTAELVCMRSRTAGLLVFSAWPELSEIWDEEQIAAFHRSQERARDLTLELAAQNGNPTLKNYAESLDRRITTLKALQSGNIQAVQEYLEGVLSGHQPKVFPTELAHPNCSQFSSDYTLFAAT